MLFFGVCFFLYFIKLSAGNGFCCKPNGLQLSYSSNLSCHVLSCPVLSCPTCNYDFITDN